MSGLALFALNSHNGGGDGAAFLTLFVNVDLENDGENDVFLHVWPEGRVRCPAMDLYK